MKELSVFQCVINPDSTLLDSLWYGASRKDFTSLKKQKQQHAHSCAFTLWICIKCQRADICWNKESTARFLLSALRQRCYSLTRVLCSNSETNAAAEHFVIVFIQKIPVHKQLQHGGQSLFCFWLEHLDRKRWRDPIHHQFLNSYSVKTTNVQPFWCHKRTQRSEQES